MVHWKISFQVKLQYKVRSLIAYRKDILFKDRNQLILNEI